MKKLLVFFSFLTIAGIMAVNFTSCTKEEPIPDPTLVLQADIDPNDGYTVILTVQVTDVASLSWDYGDGENSTQSGSHNYTYLASGDYTITVTATGDNGMVVSKTANVTIVASIEEMLAGADDNGKTWVLTQADGAGKMGVGDVDNNLDLKMDVIPAGILAAFGMESEYTDEFTFYKDGKFTVDTKNGKGIASALYGGILLNAGITTDVYMSPSINDLPLSIVPMAGVENGTWELSYESFSIMAQNEIDIPSESQVLEEKTFSFTEGDTRVNLKLSTGAYIGFFDMTYPAALMQAIGQPAQDVDNSFYIIKNVTPDEINIAIASCGLGDLLIYPTYMLHLTFVPK
jgi:PKD repeat protein